MIIEAQAATTWTVCASGCDYPSIKAAIAAPTTVDGDTLAIAAGTYTEPGILVNKSLTLQGKEAATTIVQAAATQGTASDRVFTIASGVSVTLQNLTIRYGYRNGAGGGLYNAGTLTVTDSTVHSNQATYAGGGLYNDYNGTLTLTTTTVSDNAATYGGGLSNDGTGTLIASTISTNAAGLGGGLSNYGTLLLTNSTMSGNTATGAGGGLYNRGRLTLTHSTMSGNATDTFGGGLYNAYGTLTLIHSLVAKTALYQHSCYQPQSSHGRA